MMGVVLPWFSVLNAAGSVGLMEGALIRAAAHVTSTRFVHLNNSIADLPTVRAYLARARIQCDSAATLLDDTVAAIATPRADNDDAARAGGQGPCGRNRADRHRRRDAGVRRRRVPQDVGVERLFRDSRAASLMAPTSDVLYDFIGKAVLGMPLF
jgi:alkylation response protein AidB-like acyl-CoA dehydrogenase